MKTSISYVAVAQGNSLAAGVGALNAFQLVLLADLQLAEAGDVTFNLFSDDGWILSSGPGLGGQPTYVSGAFLNAPPRGYLRGDPVVGSFNVPSSPAQNTVSVHFPGAGSYPIELDYTECCGGQLSLVLGTSFGNPIPPKARPPLIFVPGFGGSQIAATATRSKTVTTSDGTSKQVSYKSGEPHLAGWWASSPGGR